MGDPITYRYSGLRSYHYQSELSGAADTRRITARTFDQPFPTGRIVTPLYLDYLNYKNLPKPPRFRTFFVMRDPRDITVSWYFSAKYSHRLMGNLADAREILNRVSTEDGLLYVLDYLEQFGLFAAMASWAGATDDPDVQLVRFEELTANQGREGLRKVYDHVGIRVPDDEFNRLVDKYSFKKLSGRSPGEENKRSHYRKGSSGDWERYFSSATHDRFESLTNGLLGRLGYE